MTLLSAKAVAPLLRATARSRSSETERPSDVYEPQYRVELDTDRDGTVNADELQRFAQARSRVSWIPLSSMLSTEKQLALRSTQFATTQQALARSLVKARGSANQDDVEAVVSHLVRLPASVLVGIQRAGLSVVVCRGGVTDYVKTLEREPVRGHKAGDSWDKTPGTVWNREVVIATMESLRVPGQRMVPPRGRGHDTYDLILHELGHGIARNLGQFEGTKTTADRSDAHAGATFLAARNEDWDRLRPYYRQDGRGSGAGADETFAESFARFYGGDPSLEHDWPALYRFWNDNRRAIPVSAR
ncbi:MAG: hypothetical protein ACAI38_09680 [Myxococcota bacterium]